MGDLYLRDLKPELQEDWKRRWKDHGRKDLLRAEKAGKDIAVGNYFRGDGEVV